VGWSTAPGSASPLRIDPMKPTAQDHHLDPGPRAKSMNADDSNNPLWTVAIGIACVFAAMAAVMAFG